MKTEFEPCSSLTGWSGTATGYSVNQVPNYIAGLNTASNIFYFSGAGQYIQKTETLDVSTYDYIVFHIWSRFEKNTGQGMDDSSAFKYKIDFGTGEEFYIPIGANLDDVTVAVSSMTTKVINKIKITSLSADTDYIILSSFCAVKDEIPRDIFQAIKEQIQANLAIDYLKISGGTQYGVLLGTVTGLTVGDKSVILTGINTFCDKYSTILIRDNTHSEIHQLDDNDEIEYKFADSYDGKTLKYSYTTANIYIIIPVEYGLSEKQIILPGISIWGLEGEPIYRNNKIDNVYDTFKTDGSVSQRLDDQINEYDILIDCEARQNELVVFMAKSVMRLIGRNYLWINGRKFFIDFSGKPTNVEVTTPENQIPKLQYLMKVEIKENIWERTTIPATTQTSLTWIISQQGSL